MFLEKMYSQKKHYFLLSIIFMLFLLVPTSIGHAAGDLVISEDMVLSQDLDVTGNLTIMNGVTLDLNGFKLNVAGNLDQQGKMVFTHGSAEVNNFISGNELTMDNDDDNLIVKGKFILKNDSTFNNFSSTITVNGNVEMNIDKDHSINLDRARLNITGDFIQSSGQLNVGKGELVINGNYRIQKPLGTDYTSGYGSLRMDDSEGYVLVKGNFITQSNLDYGYNYLGNGVLEIKGNFEQKEGDKQNFRSCSDHKVILSGTSVQDVKFASAGDDDSFLNVLDIENPAGITCSSSIGFAFLNSKLNTVKINSDFNIATGGQIATTKPIEITGNLGLDTDKDHSLGLNQAKIHVTGNFIQPSGQMNIQKGQLKIDGDYRIQKPSEETSDASIIEYTDSYGSLRMDDAEGYVLVKGNFTTQSNLDYGYNYLGNGILEIKGNFEQIEGSVEGSKQNFRSCSYHKVLLSGTSVQDVKFANAGDDDSFFNVLDIENPAGITCSSPIGFASLNSKLDTVKINSDFNIVTGEQIATAKPIEITGNLGLNTDKDHSLGLNQAKIHATGNFIQLSGQMNIQKGQLKIDGDYRIQKPSEETSDASIIEYTDSYGSLRMDDAEGYVLVKGNFITQSNLDYEYNYLGNGVLEIKGNFQQKEGSVEGSKQNFRSCSYHKVILSGSSLQTVSFENPNDDECTFNILQLTNSNVKFLTAYKANQVINGGLPSGDFKEWKQMTGIAPDKVWSIGFTNPVDKNSITSSTVFITDENGILIPSTPTLDATNKVIKITPASSYTSGKTYYLFITQDVKNSDGKNLKKGIKMIFSIK